MISLSTSFISSQIDNGDSLVATMADLPIDGVELEYRISKPMLEQMRQPLKQSGLKITSLHNYCPIPSLTPPVKGSGDLFLLSSLEPEERQRAVSWTLETIEHANDLEAPVVILHCGRVEMPPEIDRLYQFYHSGRIDSDDAQTFRQHKLDERDQFVAVHADALLFALDQLMGYAEKQGVILGLENRYHYHELPTPAVFELLLAEFKGGPIGYWHDTGHAHANEVLGIIEPGILLQDLAKHLIGIHWHDARGLDDHLPPGQGEIDFNPLKPYIHEKLPIVIELKPGTSHEQVQKGIQYTREQLLCATKSRSKDTST